MVNETDNKQMNSKQQGIRDLNAMIAYYLQNGSSSLEEAWHEMIAKELAKRRERIARNNAKLAALMSQVTDQQADSIYRNEANGYKFNQVVYDRRNPKGNVAVMYVKDPVWNEMTGRMGRKTMVIYSNGETETTFNKGIEIRDTL